MPSTIQETATVSQTTIDYDKVLKIEQGEWTIQSLGIEIEGKLPYTKTDFVEALKKVSRKVKK